LPPHERSQAQKQLWPLLSYYLIMPDIEILRMAQIGYQAERAKTNGKVQRA
jgi:hypothetical protein